VVTVNQPGHFEVRPAYGKLTSMFSAAAFGEAVTQYVQSQWGLSPAFGVDRRPAKDKWYFVPLANS
jgi:hypothetical protein